ncbi:hypothetical protein MBM_08591 [Drepanopeziza brunnea f. sp. 'multigermtubi' MB_m1]|uniref:Uncharacterized protein n=1 Tax=Marssonina brunnea f. sp. multigermtubi (strain MB_m1) TaxID=1072389 RepID=K1WWV8_MARBU|nr:uncharacterized protein MBM_08591 [Drepanopeziza brunnea f. sp. 'multigermtubi' MB_m1]EKD13148.1 hypothetical protein MBM_08591 [Drepanopeziza brunnea f. sp. 'multigermtubi' MB_m1]
MSLTLSSASESKPTTDQQMTEAPDSPPDNNTAHVERTNFNHTSSASQASGNSSSNSAKGETKANFGTPGSSYTSKKFQEEYDRMESLLLDRNWENLYGDVVYRGNQ